MKVFISWSDRRSKEVATALYKWVPTVIQAVKPWMSDRDIPAGADWWRGIRTELDDSSVGIICLTPENLKGPWLRFEAGAIAKRLEGSRVFAYLFGLTSATDATKEHGQREKALSERARGTTSERVAHSVSDVA